MRRSGRKLKLSSPERVKTMSANEKQVDGEHYQTEIQPWDFIEANRLTFIARRMVFET